MIKFLDIPFYFEVLIRSVHDFNDNDIDYDSAKVFKFFDDVEVESYGGPKES